MPYYPHFTDRRCEAQGCCQRSQSSPGWSQCSKTQALSKACGSPRGYLPHYLACLSVLRIGVNLNSKEAHANKSIQLSNLEPLPPWMCAAALDHVKSAVPVQDGQGPHLHILTAFDYGRGQLYTASDPILVRFFSITFNWYSAAGG